MGLKIGEVAQRGGVNLQTIRFYERERLLPKPPRLASGYRVFPEQTVLRIRFIKRAQQLGFSLAEIRELLSLQLDPKRDCSDVRRLAQTKAAEIDDKIHTLTAMQRILHDLAERCQKRGAADPCPILASIAREEEPRC
ncbi:MAG: MerR family transcriptional regulator [Terriglobales bacterium]